MSKHRPPLIILPLILILLFASMINLSLACETDADCPDGPQHCNSEGNCDENTDNCSNVICDQPNTHCDINNGQCVDDGPVTTTSTTGTGTTARNLNHTIIPHPNYPNAPSTNTDEGGWKAEPTAAVQITVGGVCKEITPISKTMFIPTATDNEKQRFHDWAIANPSEVTITNCAVAATCSDSIQNQGETGVDCGGPCSACSGGGGGGGSCNGAWSTDYFYGCTAGCGGGTGLEYASCPPSSCCPGQAPSRPCTNNNACCGGSGQISCSGGAYCCPSSQYCWNGGCGSYCSDGVSMSHLGCP